MVYRYCEVRNNASSISGEQAAFAAAVIPLCRKKYEETMETKEGGLRGIDGEVKQRAWTGMLHQAPERSAIDLIARGSPDPAAPRGD